MIIEDIASVPAGNPLYRWEPRTKLIGIMCLAFAFAAVRDLRLLPVMLALSLFLFVLSSLPFSYLLGRMRIPGIFLLAMAVVLPFFSGNTVLVQLGPVSLKQEGCVSLLLIAVKFLCIVTIAVVLFASTPLTRMLGSMRSLGLPPLLGDMMLFTYRYIFQLAADFHRASTAACLRGARMRSLKSLKTTAYIVGSLMVRSHERAERVFHAMTLRGYGRQDMDFYKAKIRPPDVIAGSACVLAAAGFVLFQLLMP
ncbi:MAG: cobalt ECF transporter T component CbiQ [Actinobacteria bacterium]|nr:cobalt ECF transporter T component CbiQ [Actinomycetota bacterium]